MECSPELLQSIKEAIEGTEYGSVEISLNEKGSFVELTVKKKVRYDKDLVAVYHNG